MIGLELAGCARRPGCESLGVAAMVASEGRWGVESDSAPWIEGAVGRVALCNDIGHSRARLRRALLVRLAGMPGVLRKG
jgi:hypothetical protein